MKDQDLKNAKKQQAEPENGECRCKHEGKNSDKACGDNDKEHKCCREESGEHEECKCHNHHGHGGTCCHEADKEAGDGSCQCKHDKNADSDLLKKLDEATAAAAKNRDLYMRAVADLENYRRKVQREKEELSKFAISPLVESLLPSLDTLAMAIGGLESNPATKTYAEGLVMVDKQVKKVLESFGVKEIDPMGQDFDPNNAECVAHEPSAEVPEGKVMGVMRLGYSLNGRLIRPASVVVSKGEI